MAARSGDKLDISSTEGPPGAVEVRFRVRVKPRASRNLVLGVKASELEICVNAPPAEGAANAAVVEILGAFFGVPKTNVTILTGKSGRSKLVRVLGVGKDACLARLGS